MSNLLNEVLNLNPKKNKLVHRTFKPYAVFKEFVKVSPNFPTAYDCMEWLENNIYTLETGEYTIQHKHKNYNDIIVTAQVQDNKIIWKY